MSSCVHRQWADPGSRPVAQSHPMLRAGKRCQKSMVQTGPQRVLWPGVSPAGCSGQLSKAISIDFCCYSYIASSKNSSLHPKIQFNCVFLCMFCFTWDILGSKSSICSKPAPCFRTLLLFHQQCSPCVALLELSPAVPVSQEHLPYS